MSDRTDPNSNTMNNTMRNLVLTVSALLAGGAAGHAQEMLPREEAMRYALVAALHEPSSLQAPIRVDADLKRPVAGYDGDYGALILPETKLTAATLESVGAGVVPVGQLWLKKLTPMVQGSGVEPSELQMVRIFHEGESARVPLCLLGVAQGRNGGLELLVYGKGKEPLLRLPLRKVERAQSLPIELSAEREYDSGRMTLRLVGRYEATLSVTELPE